ncbi:MAG: hypothetical protein JWO95_1575 [Verrucomicrobiales bacterium]|nr:hypothetical protein [Verrucomicrobiales bacterium]
MTNSNHKYIFLTTRLGPLRSFTILEKGKLRSGKFPERRDFSAKGDS